MDEKLLRLREEEFPVARHCIYLNHAAIGPLPRRSAERMADLARTVSESGDRHWFEHMEEAERVRGLAARLLGAREPHEVAFVENTSTGLSLIAEGLDWRPGDNVVSAELEFPSNVYPWMRLAEHGIEYRPVPERDGRIDPDELIARMDGRTRVLTLSWVQYASGYRADLVRLGEACRERGALFVVDVIQGLGALALNVEHDLVDVAVASSHKWLLGPEGIGLLYVSDRVLNRLRPARAGWRSMHDPFRWKDFALDWNEGAKRFETGILNVYGIAALGGSLEVLEEAGSTAVERRVLALASLAARGLADRGFHVISSRRRGETSGIVTATHPDHNPEDLVRHLAAQDIIVAARAERLRVSPHFYNTVEEVERFLEGLG